MPAAQGTVPVAVDTGGGEVGVLLVSGFEVMPVVEVVILDSGVEVITLAVEVVFAVPGRHCE